MHISKKRKGWHILYAMVLASFTMFVLLDTFVLTHSYAVVEDNSDTSSNTHSSNTSHSKAASVVTDTTYSDDNINIAITQYREYDTDIYVADITLSSADYLKTAFANNTYGKNVVATTSSIASENNSILAINGDYYGVQESGYVLRNGTIYRSELDETSKEDLVINSDGSFSIVTEGETTLTDLKNSGALQVLSFGPALMEDGQISVSETEEVGKAMKSNPRTAIGIIDDLHYVMVVSDGRTNESTGLSLYQFASFMETLGVKTAYNLDGGGSSTMVFNGQVINNPTSSGKRISERKVSDIVYIGYE